MADISISLSDVQNVKSVEIKDLGTLYIRKLGSGEELDMSVRSRRIDAIIKELSHMDFMQYDSSKPTDVKKIEKLQNRADKLTGELAEIKQHELDMYRRLMSDDKKGAVVDVILNTLSDDERTELIRQAFTPKPITDVETDSSEQSDES